jgi:hypothetical protein
VKIYNPTRKIRTVKRSEREEEDVIREHRKRDK